MICYRIKKWIGSFAAALAGVDTLTGVCRGIELNPGEAHMIAKTLCRFLGFDCKKEN